MTESVWHDILIELRRLDDEQALARQLLAGMPEDEPADHLTAWRDQKALSGSVNSLHAGIERIMILIAEQIDGGAPAGSARHRRLLDRMSHEGVDCRRRPALLSDTARAGLEDMWAFKQRARVDTTLDWGRARRAGHAAVETVSRFREDLFRLGRTLELYSEDGAGT